MGIILDKKGRRFKLPEIKRITDNAYRVYNNLIIGWKTFDVPYIEHTIFTLRKTISENKRNIKRLKKEKHGNPNVGGGETALTGSDKHSKGYSISVEASGTDVALDAEDKRLSDLRDKLNKLKVRR